MSKTRLIKGVALRTAQPMRAVASIIDAFLECLTDQLGGDGKVTLAGFGSFRVRRREMRKGIHIRTGEPMVIPAAKVVRFKVGSRLRKALR